ncbi:phage filamentation protein Fil family protein [Erwinia tracheiphila]
MRGWLETPDGRFFQPKASEVQFIKGRRIPFFVSSRTRRRWFSGHDADLVLVMDCQIPTDDLIVHDL